MSREETVGDVRTSLVEPGKLVVACPSVMVPGHPQALLQVLYVGGAL